MEKTSAEIPNKIPTQQKNLSSSNKDYIEVKIPRISFKNTGINAYLVTALVIFAFFLGMLTDKVLFLEKTLKNRIADNTALAAQNNDTADNARNNEQIPTQPPAKTDVSIGHLPTLGADNTKVIVIEFSDFQCPYCEKFLNDTYPQIYDTYIKTNKIKFAYRHYPLNSIHPNAQKAAEASECANEQNKFWDYSKILFKNQAAWSPQSLSDTADSFTDYAAQLGLNTDQFRSCLNTDKYKENVQKDASEGDTSGVDGTPTLFINGIKMVGAQPFSEIQKLIEQELKK